MTIEVSDVISVNGSPDDVALLSEKRRADELCDTKAGQGNDSRLTLGFEFGELTTGPRDRNDAFDQTHPSTGIDPLDTVSIGLDPAKYSLDRPLDSRNGGDAEPLVDRSAALIVNTSDNAFDVEKLSGCTGDENIGVVAVRDRRKSIGTFDTSSTQSSAIESDAHDGVATEVLGQTTERCYLPVNNRNSVALFQQCDSETGTDSTASNDNDVHFSPPPGVLVDTESDPMATPQELKDDIGQFTFVSRKETAKIDRDPKTPATPAFDTKRLTRALLSSLSHIHGASREIPCR